MSPRRREGPRLRSNGIYYLDIVLGFGPARKRVMFSLGTSDPKVARALWEKERRRLWDRYYGGSSGVPVGPVYFADLVPKYIEYCRDVRKASTWPAMKSRLDIAAKAWGDVTLSDITAAHVGVLEKHLAALPLKRSKATVNHYVALVKSFFNWSIDQGYFTGRNPMRSVKPYPVDQKRRAYSADEMRKIVDSAGKIAAAPGSRDELFPHARRLVLLLYYTGMRLGEALNLRWGNITGDIIRLERTETKQRREKVIPITAPMRSILDELAAGRRDEFVFPIHQSSGATLRSTRAEDLLARIRRESGIADFLFHGLRHTASTLMAANIGKGATLQDVMSVLGHSRTETTLKYTHSDRDRMRSALASIPEIEYIPAVEKAKKPAVPRAGVGQSRRKKR